MLIAYLYCVLIVGVIGFQIALIMGAPWGRLTQGGVVDGTLPASGRIAAAGSVVILVAMALAILSAVGSWPGWPIWTGWAAVATSAVVMVLNWITPSASERRLWAPITSIMFILALLAVFF